MSDNEDSKKISKYDELVVKKYKEFVGENELRQLLKRFTPEKFAGVWKQAMCSSSTRFLGSGPNYSSVQAKYTLKENNIVGVRNDAYDNDFRKAGITGTSGARDVSVPTCRTVKFNNLLDIEMLKKNTKQTKTKQTPIKRRKTEKKISGGWKTNSKRKNTDSMGKSPKSLSKSLSIDTGKNDKKL